MNFQMKIIFILIITILFLQSCSDESSKNVENFDKLMKIRCGEGHKISLFSDGKLFFDGKYPLLDKDIPTDLTDLFPSQVLEFSTNREHSCFITTEGELYCIGGNSFGELAQEPSNGVNRPIKIELPMKVIAVSVGENFSCAVVSDKTVYCWGKNSSGELGNGKTADDYPSTQKAFEFQPQKVLNITNAIKIQSGRAHTCALLENGFISCWGSNFYREISESQNTDKIATPLLLIEYPNISDISLGGNSTCFLKNSSILKCIGKNFNSTTAINIDISSLNFIKRFSVSEKYGCATTNLDKLYCWGDNQNEVFNAPQILHKEIVEVEYPHKILELSAAPDKLCIRDKK